MQQIATATFDHARQESTAGIDMGHKINVHHTFPVVIRQLNASHFTNTGVGAEQIDATLLLFNLLDHRLDFRLDGDITADGLPADVSCDAFGRFKFPINHNLSLIHI